ncbi:hypothetical protein FH972_018245 [Carpinus fangiana]|uniref:Uncharacterized protein n=1 Tax=Carpinus fangiana TaxID=176857 RepID=A0A5N6RLX2_9ROSI|nr:hypothetical protein FH972_018245 [Carpinus fangiana]
MVGVQQNIAVSDLGYEVDATPTMKGKNTEVGERYVEEISGKNFPTKKFVNIESRQDVGDVEANMEALN